ncbi:MAG: hypothetical protein GX752_04185 [Clostridium sp.]|nr:hypothetical protein [Clostridium sp.]
MLQTYEIIRAFSAIIAITTLGISGLSFYTIYKLKQTPTEERNLLEYQSPEKYTRLGYICLGLSILFAVIAFIVSK